MRMAELEAEAHELAGRPFNLGSPKQIGEVLFGEMGLPGGKKTATGAVGHRRRVLEDLAAQGHELPRVLLDWRQLSKLKGTYTDNLVAAIDAEHRPGPHLLSPWPSTTTGRLASSDPNLQNIPIRTEEGRKIRQAFIAEPGHVLISADYSQIELRLLAHIGDIPAAEDAPSRTGLDIHAMTASEMFGVPVEGMPAETRRRAKAINFGIVYGISAFGLANQLSHPAGRGRGLYQDLFRALPRHPRLHGRDAGRGRASTASSPPSSAARSTSRPSTRKSRRRAPVRRTRGDQRPDPGRRRRHHPPRHDPHAGRADGRRA